MRKEGESVWRPIIEQAEKEREANYTNHLFALHHSVMPDWSEEVLRRVRGEVELPAPAASGEAFTEEHQ